MTFLLAALLHCAPRLPAEVKEPIEIGGLWCIQRPRSFEDCFPKVKPKKGKRRRPIARRSKR